jgi:hypothetical protein
MCGDLECGNEVRGTLCTGSRKSVLRAKISLISFSMILVLLFQGSLTFPNETGGLIINLEQIPYEAGTRWVYAVSGKSVGTQPRTLTVQLQKSGTGKPDLLESVHFFEGAGIRRLYFRVLPSAVAIYSSPEESTLLQKITFPLKLGVEMEYGPPGSQSGSRRAIVRVIAQEKISVPYGTFTCLKLDVKPSDAQNIQEFSQWIAPNVGMVKQRVVSPQGEHVLELTAFRRNAEDIWASISPPTYQTSFSTSHLDDWISASGSWRVTDGVLSSGGQGKEYIWLRPYVWQDCKISYRFRIVSGGDAWISFRANFLDEPHGFSYFQIDDGSVKIRHTGPGGFDTISNYASAPENNQWHTVECTIKGSEVKCFTDGASPVTTRKCPVNFGMIGFRTLDTKFQVDDLRVERFSPEGSKSASSVQSDSDTSSSLIITADQIPMQVGNKWIFAIRSNDETLNGKQFFYYFYDKFEHGGRTFFRRQAEIPEIYQRTDGLQLLRPDGWFGFWEPKDKAPYDIIKFPLSAGMSWQQDVLFKDKSGGKQLRWNKWEAEAEEMISVPAGMFRCIRLRYFNYTIDKSDDALVWLAPHVGLVKFIEGGHTFDLLKFERTAGGSPSDSRGT